MNDKCNCKTVEVSGLSNHKWDHEQKDVNFVPVVESTITINGKKLYAKFHVTGFCLLTQIANLVSLKDPNVTEKLVIDKVSSEEIITPNIDRINTTLIIKKLQSAYGYGYHNLLKNYQNNEQELAKAFIDELAFQQNQFNPNASTSPHFHGQADKIIQVGNEIAASLGGPGPVYPNNLLANYKLFIPYFPNQFNQAEKILDAFNTPSKTYYHLSLDEIVEKVEKGHGVILNVNASDLWEKIYNIPAPNEPHYGLNHAITITRVKIVDGKAVGFYITESNNNDLSNPNNKNRDEIEISNDDLFHAASSINNPLGEKDKFIATITDETFAHERKTVGCTCGKGCQCGNLNKEINSKIVFISELYSKAITQHDPLVLDLDGDGIETIKLNDSNVYFDLDNDGFKEKSGWVSKDDGILIVDENNNGLVDGISELFGNTTINGFDELKLSDSNNDGKIDSQDANFTKIKIWQDLNENGISEAGELKTLAELNIKSINLNYTPVNQNNNGNLVSEISTFTFNDDTTSTVADVNFAVDNVDSVVSNEITLSSEVLSLPVLRGYGIVKDLSQSMMDNVDLKNYVDNISSNTTTILDLYSSMDELLAKWAGVEDIDLTAMRESFNATKLVTEKFMAKQTFLRHIKEYYCVAA